MELLESVENKHTSPSRELGGMLIFNILTTCKIWYTWYYS